MSLCYKREKSDPLEVCQKFSELRPCDSLLLLKGSGYQAPQAILSAIEHSSWL